MIFDIHSFFWALGGAGILITIIFGLFFLIYYVTKGLGSAEPHVQNTHQTPLQQVQDLLMRTLLFRRTCRRTLHSSLNITPASDTPLSNTTSAHHPTLTTRTRSTTGSPGSVTSQIYQNYAPPHPRRHLKPAPLARQLFKCHDILLSIDYIKIPKKTPICS